MKGDRLVVPGADTDSLSHHTAVLDAATGALLAERQFPATAGGYRQVSEFVAGFGRVVRFGVEGTNTYGLLLPTSAFGRSRDARGDRAQPCNPPPTCKSDPRDAISAAQAALADEQLPIPKSSDGPVESIRVLMVVRDSVVKARATVLRQIAMLRVSVPPTLREQLSGPSEKERNC